MKVSKNIFCWVLESDTKKDLRQNPSSMIRGQFRFGGFTLLEMLVVLILISLAATLILPFNSKTTERNKERKFLYKLADSISDLKMKCGGYGYRGELFVEDDALHFLLNGKSYLKIPHTGIEISNKIFFNRNGFTNGGIIAVVLRFRYVIHVKKIHGEIAIEKSSE